MFIVVFTYELADYVGPTNHTNSGLLYPKFEHDFEYIFFQIPCIGFGKYTNSIQWTLDFTSTTLVG